MSCFFFGRPDGWEESFSERMERFCCGYREIFEELGKKRLWEEPERVFIEERAKRGELEANLLFA